MRFSPFQAVNDTPHPPMYNSEQVTSPPEVFQHAEHRRFLPALFNVQNRAFWKPLAEIFLKYLFTSINSHRLPQ